MCIIVLKLIWFMVSLPQIHYHNLPGLGQELKITFSDQNLIMTFGPET